MYKNLFLLICMIPLFMLGQVGINLPEGTLPKKMLHVNGNMRFKATEIKSTLPGEGHWVFANADGDLIQYEFGVSELVFKNGKFSIRNAIREINANAIINADDETILSKATSDITITLPDATLPENKGRTLIFKTFSTGGITFTSPNPIRITAKKNLTTIAAKEVLTIQANAASGVWEVLHYKF